MQKRRLGRTEHMSAVAILGTFAFSNVTQAQADAAMEQVIAAGVNHIDVAPTYGQAEERLAPWLARERDRFFLACKTAERDKEEAAREMRRSLERLGVDAFDLYQIHAVTSIEELDRVTGPHGALQAILEARAEGLTRFIGITGHGMDAPMVFREALNRFDFDSVLFPINFVLYADADYRRNAEELLHRCRVDDVGTIIIKAIAKEPWGDRPRAYNTWYEPFEGADQIQQAVDFVLSQNVTGLCTAGDITLLPRVLEACERFTPLTAARFDSLIARGDRYEPIFAGPKMKM